jgi:hypothetical protein
LAASPAHRLRGPHFFSGIAAAETGIPTHMP